MVSTATSNLPGKCGLLFLAAACPSNCKKCKYSYGLLEVLECNDHYGRDQNGGKHAQCMREYLIS